MSFRGFHCIFDEQISIGRMTPLRLFTIGRIKLFQKFRFDYFFRTQYIVIPVS